jgi:hypothetical protein
MIDFVDLLPFNLPGSVFETLFLMYLGVPPVNSVIRGAIDLIPILDWIPWCTLIVLHLRFGVDFGRFNVFLPGRPPRNGVPSRPAPVTPAPVKKEPVPITNG